MGLGFDRRVLFADSSELYERPHEKTDTVIAASSAGECLIVKFCHSVLTGRRAIILSSHAPVEL